MPFRRILPLFVLFLAAVSSAQAQSYRDGLQAFRAGQAEKAYEIWNPLADTGDALAQFGLALIYERGSETIPQDLDAAVKWYELAAVQGVAAGASANASAIGDMRTARSGRWVSTGTKRVTR